MSLQQQFTAFAKFGDTKADGVTITLTQSDKWMKQANIFDKKITTTDTGICFGKFKSRTINYDQYVKFVEDLANYRGANADELKSKLTKCGTPGLSSTTGAAKMSVVDRLTDTSKYTGAHKQRFDESGKGRGKAGRTDEFTNTGYTGQYKGAGTFDKR